MESAAAPHERWAKLATRMLGTEHAGDDTTERDRPSARGINGGIRAHAASLSSAERVTPQTPAITSPDLGDTP